MVDSAFVEIEGLVLSERHVDNGKREICIQTKECESASTVLLDAKASSETAKWFTVKKARNLIYPGIGLRVVGSIQHGSVIHASSIDIVSVNPRKEYLARLFSFSLDDLHLLFPSQHSENTVLPSEFIEACAPVSVDRLEKVFEFCQEERMAGRGVKLWKTPMIEELSAELFASQSDNSIIQPKPKNLGIPKVSKQSLDAVCRLERMYVRPSDGIVDEYTFHPETSTYSTENSIPVDGLAHEVVRYGDYDPCHNLPNVSDERRLKYVDERKRPQIKCMLEILRRLLERKKGQKQQIRTVDIGGGRGYFGIAVAGTFSNVHVTIVDSNEPSLDAGRSRAKAAGLDNMEFVHCDLSDTSHAEKLKQHQFDVVFGLHCCGGLAEAAVELAFQSMADFCVSTCCFRSNPGLASLTHLAERLVKEKVGLEEGNEILSRYQRDVAQVASLAVTVGGTDQHRAIRVYNSMRLVTAEEKFASLHSHFVLKTWQEKFPVEYSVQNRVLVGVIDESDHDAASS